MRPRWSAASAGAGRDHRGVATVAHRRYNRAVRRLLPLLAAVTLLLALAPVSGVLADDPTVDPRPVTVDVDLSSEPLVPYIAALLVMSAVLMVVGVVAMRVTRKPSPGARALGRAAWWACPACAASNAGDRDACYACAAPRRQPPAERAP